MIVKCPCCQVTVQLLLKRQHGNIYTSRGIQIRGKIDESTGLATSLAFPPFIAEDRTAREIYAYFDLQGAQYCIAQCTSCQSEFIYSHASGKPIWPLPESTLDREIPEKIAKVFVEAKKAHAVGAETAALLAARTALIRCLREQSSSTLQDMAKQGKITSLLYGQSNEIRLWANVAGHEDVPADTPEPQDIDELLGYLDLLFDTLYVQPSRLKGLQEKRKNLS